MSKRHVVIVPRKEGTIETTPMKAWLRLNSAYMPPDLDADPTKSTSHQLRSGLKRNGWTMEETHTEVRLLPPGNASLLNKVREAVLDEDAESEGVESEGEDVTSSGFVYETHLRDYIADNISTIKIGGTSLKLYADDNGSGVEYKTDVGRIDILAQDGHGAIYVIELKRSESPDHVVGQLARYMGWAKSKFGPHKDIFGVIVAEKIGDRIKFARLAIPNVLLFEYRLSFSLQEAHSVS